MKTTSYILRYYNILFGVSIKIYKFVFVYYNTDRYAIIKFLKEKHLVRLPLQGEYSR